jgi:hypothetical protein
MMDDDWKLDFYRFQANEWLETARAAKLDGNDDLLRHAQSEMRNYVRALPVEEQGNYELG